MPTTVPTTVPTTAPTKANKKLTQAERTEQSDHRMFKAAVRLINEYGPSGTNLKDVGVEAGYSRGLANHRFGNKDKLFVFMIQRLCKTWLKEVEEATKGRHGFDAIESALQLHYSFSETSPDYIRAFYILWFESINADDELRATIRQIHQQHHDEVCKWLSGGTASKQKLANEPSAIAALFCNSMIGIVYFWLANPSELEKIKRMHDDLRDQIHVLLA